MKKIFLPMLISLLLFSCNPDARQKTEKTSGNQVSVTINPQSQTDVFEGIGAVSAGASSRLLLDYPEPYRSQILDYLFLPKFGAGFQHLKVEIGGDINSTDGTEPSHLRKKGEENFTRGYEWWLMKEAVSRNPDIILDGLAWGAPGWLGDGKFYSKDGADYFVSFIKGAKEVYGLDIKYIGIWNEREFDPEWIKLYRKTLDENGLNHVKIVAADLNGPPERIWSIAEAMAKDPKLAKSVDIIGVHYPHGVTLRSAFDLKKAGKRLWSSEDGEWNWTTMHPLTNLRAQKINTNFIKFNLTKTEFWSPVTAYYDCLPAPHSGVITANTPWSGAYTVDQKLWAVGHTTQFAKPGWEYIIDGCKMLPSGGSVVAYTSPDKKDVSIIIETTDATSDQELVIIPAGTFVQGSLSVWQSNPLENFVRTEDLNKKDENFTLVLKPNCIYSLTTTSGQKKGVHSSPVNSPFPLPYDEDFEKYKLSRTPRYLCDQGGAFEVEKLHSGSKVLVQQIERRGIDWSEATFAYSIIGDINWNNIDVASDMAFVDLPSDTAALSGLFMQISARCYNGSTWAAFGKPYPVGYSFRIYANGKWEIATPLRILATGKMEKPGNLWRNLKITCIGERISAFVDGIMMKEVTDASYQQGLVSIGCSFTRVGFDNLRISEPGVNR
jgi:O-glycosyl hydrolase